MIANQLLTTLVPAPSAGRGHTCACGTVQAELTEKNKEKTLCSLCARW
jgi:hypothetical protein